MVASEKQFEPSFRDHLRPEIELILCALRTKIGRTTLERIIALLHSKLDWDYLVGVAFRHAVTALLFRSLTRIAPDAVPVEIAGAVNVFMRRQGDRNQLLADELCHILRGLESQRIPAIPFKGPILSEVVYMDLGLRSFRDLDFLIHESDFHGCLDVLRQLDYQVNLDMTPAQEAAFRKYSGQDSFSQKDRGIIVEPHWAFVPSNILIRIDYEAVWRRARTLDVNGARMLSLAPEDLIIVLCVHGSKEQWSRLQMICDVNETVSAYPSLDWDAAFSYARAQRCLRMLLLGLRISGRLLGTTLPSQAIPLLAAKPEVDRLAQQSERLLFGPAYVLPSPWVVSRFRMQMHDTFTGRILYLIRTITTPRVVHFRLVRLPDALFFCYFPTKVIHDYLLLPCWLAVKFLFRLRR